MPLIRTQPAWRTDGEDKRIGLKITKAGSAAIGIEDEDRKEREGAPEPTAKGSAKTRSPASPRGALGPRAGSKQALVISLLERTDGAILDDLIEATGWLPHTARAALTGLRKKGYALAKSKSEDGKTAYRIEGGNRAAGEASPAALAL